VISERWPAVLMDSDEESGSCQTWRIAAGRRIKCEGCKKRAQEDSCRRWRGDHYLPHGWR